MPRRPLDRFPDNPRYFRFRGLPTVLITSAEHYGAVFNLDFDYSAYLAELTRCRFNYTRAASGTFVENEHTIEGSAWENTQAPRPLRYVAPWERTSVPGYHRGGTRFDLTEVSDAYLDRLTDFVGQAGLRGIIVEVTLFTAMYSHGHWLDSPMHHDNNVNSLTPIEHDQVYRLDNGGLLEHQLHFVQRVARALSGFDNVLVELINEPYFSGVEDLWIDAAVDAIRDQERESGTQELLLSWNYANVRGRIFDMNPELGAFTFHYANPPDVVAENDDLAVPVVYDETGYAGIDDTVYRVHAWQFLLAGGAGFNHLDYTFGTGEESDGSRVLPGNASGGGGRRFRDQLRVLADFIAALPVAEMRPVTMLAVAAGAERATRQLAAPGRAYAFYLYCPPGDALVDHIEFEAEPGDYLLTWIDPVTGFAVETVYRIANAGPCRIPIPARRGEVAAMLLPDRPRLPREVGDFDFVEAAQR